ncbi:MAG: hypothetical protein EOP04_18920 [Proteobacteria bacterium]|nr:MAG: hypothetical protein EOP04_18920 [Pseudomonadota bacterium]
MKHLALISLVFMTVAACGGKKTEAAKSAPAAPKIEQSTGDAGTKASDLVGTWAVCSFEGSVGLRVTIKFDAKGNLETSAGAYKDSRCKNIATRP